MSKNVEDIVSQKHLFYRDSYRRALKLLIVLSCIAVVLAAWLMYSIFTRPLPEFYATSTTGEVVPMQPLSKPVVTSSYLLQWASGVVRQVFNINFAHVDKQLAKAKANFTPAGWSAFQTAVQTTLLQAVKSEKLQVSAVVTGEPLILSTQILHGYYTWMVRVPVLLTYTSASAQRKQKIHVTLVIKRIPTLDSVKGIQVSNFYTS